ncbi:hypothetical protein DYB25_001403 [Aphanomyces astaci]|uniref:RRM domain-containing protein n=1 Tax=Aphanomyces astaci TaxID=112090 RepID=A0A397B8H7_APHAT|nr:hypothetical protein DYB25_001403 [Aphanomyces astaci]
MAGLYAESNELQMDSDRGLQRALGEAPTPTPRTLNGGRTFIQSDAMEPSTSQKRPYSSLDTRGSLPGQDFGTSSPQPLRAYMAALEPADAALDVGCSGMSFFVAAERDFKPPFREGQIPLALPCMLPNILEGLHGLTSDELGDGGRMLVALDFVVPKRKGCVKPCMKDAAEDIDEGRNLVVGGDEFRVDWSGTFFLLDGRRREKFPQRVGVQYASNNIHTRAMPRTIAGYTALPFPGAFASYLYVKKHITKSEGTEETELAADRTAYVVNLPLFATAEQVKELFNEVGAVQSVVMGKASDGTVASSAHVVFKSKATLKQLLKRSVLPAFPGSDVVHDAFEAAIQKYKADRPGLNVLKARADEFMANFDAEEAARQEREQLKTRVDADGFQTVVNTKRKRVDQEDLLTYRKKQKSKELQDFYRFQLREKKRGQLKTLRERFDEDRQMVEKMKKERKFRPETGTD